MQHAALVAIRDTEAAVEESVRAAAASAQVLCGALDQVAQRSLLRGCCCCLPQELLS